MRQINRLTAKQVAALDEPGLHADGGGLYLRIDNTGAKRWVFVFFWRKKRREMGLGSTSSTTLAKAREERDAARRKVVAGIDPIAERRVEATGVPTFGDLAIEVIAALKPGWRNPKTADQWTASLESHAAKIWRRPVDAINTEDVLEVLKPIWSEIHETAYRVRSRVERVLDVATVRGLRSGPNPARWKGHLSMLLPKIRRVQAHHAALPYEGMPDFIARLRERPAVSARALEFLILGANRTAEVLGLMWPELTGGRPWLDVRADLWIIPADRMKGGVEHRVPLADRQFEILDEMWEDRASDDGYVFPGEQRIEPLSNMAMLNLLERMGVAVTVHGFRSSFKDWAGDCTDYADEVSEQALAHVVGSKSRQAYRRRDALARRRGLMEAWAKHCTEPSNVIPLRKA